MISGPLSLRVEYLLQRDDDIVIDAKCGLLGLRFSPLLLLRSREVAVHRRAIRLYRREEVLVSIFMEDQGIVFLRFIRTWHCKRHDVD